MHEGDVLLCCQKTGWYWKICHSVFNYSLDFYQLFTDNQHGDRSLNNFCFVVSPRVLPFPFSFS